METLLQKLTTHGESRSESSEVPLFEIWPNMAAVPLAVNVYTPESPLRHPRELLRALLRDLLAARELAWRLFVRDLSANYRQTYLGYIWAFLPPLLASATFIFLQSQGITRIDGTGIPYAAFAMMGTLLWQVFADAIQSPLASINAGRSMLAKINFPREALLMSGLYMVLFNFLVRLMLLAVVMAVWKVVPSQGLLWFPLAIAGLLVCGLVMGLLLLPLGLLYKDADRGIAIVIPFWMLLTPVVYPSRTEGLAGFLVTWNPVSPVLTTAREALSGLPFTGLEAFALVSSAALLLCVLGLIAFRLIMPIVIERMGG
jgi:lipopolysaccharide transport system permease protein